MCVCMTDLLEWVFNLIGEFFDKRFLQIVTANVWIVKAQRVRETHKMNEDNNVSCLKIFLNGNKARQCSGNVVFAV